MASKRKDSWADWECAVAIWGYLTMLNDPGRKKAEIYEEISRLTGRNPAASMNKVGNVAACDPRPMRLKPVAERKHYQRRLKELFDELVDNKAALKRIVGDIRTYRANGFVPNVSIKAQGAGLASVLVDEGELLQATGTRRKRSELLRDAARDFYRDRDPDHLLRCRACGVHFDDIQSSRIIQIHHVTPISNLEGSEVAQLKDAIASTVPLCPTCHRIAHSQVPPLSIKEISRIIGEAVDEARSGSRPFRARSPLRTAPGPRRTCP